jgi:hypothetical protein
MQGGCQEEWQVKSNVANELRRNIQHASGFECSVVGFAVSLANKLHPIDQGKLIK